MFFDSTRVVIIESSIRGKQIGPKKGSEGYIISNSVSNSYAENELMDNIMLQQPKPNKTPLHGVSITGAYRTVTIDDYTYCYQKCTIYFTKFGFEKQSRMERKEVINVFPFRPDQHLEKSIFLTKKVIKTINVEYNNKLPIIIAIPDFFNSPFNMLDNPHEFEAWVTSVLQNNFLKLLLATTSNNAGSGIFLNNYALKTLLLLKTNKPLPVTPATVRNIIPTFKDMVCLYKDRGKDKKILLYDLRVINSLMIKINTDLLKTKVIISRPYVFAENAWREVALSRALRESTLNSRVKTKRAVRETRSFLVSNWAKEVKCEKKF